MLRPSPVTAGLSAAALLLAVFLVLRDAELARWLGAALLLALAWAWAPVLRARARPLRPALERLRPALPWLALAGLLLLLLGELLLGRPPATRDHGIHYFQTALLADDLLPRGQLVGWSDRLGNGYAFGESYPSLGYLWMGALHLLSLGAVSLRASYAWGVFAMWALAAWGVARLGSLVAAEVLPVEDSTEGRKKLAVSSPWAGVLGAGLWLLDPGGSREGGWNYLMFHGVWPQLLSTALWISALPLTWTAFLRPSPRRICLAGGVLGLALLAHPFGLLTVAASAGAWLVLLRVRAPERPDGSRAGHLWTWLAVHALAGLLAAGWLAGFLGSAGEMGRSPVLWQSWGSAATALVAGELFDGHRAWVGPLALIGLALALSRGRAVAWVAAGLLLATLVLASDAAITALRLDLLVSAFKNLQFPRYAIALKPLWFALAGVGAGALLTRLLGLCLKGSDENSTHGRNSDEASKPAELRLGAPALLGCALLAPLIVAVAEDFGRLVPAPVGRVGALESGDYAETDQALLASLREEQARGPLTVAFLRQGMTGAMFPLFALTDAGARLVLDGHIPSINSVHRIENRRPELLRGLGVTHVLHDRALGRRDTELAAALEPVARLGGYTLARLKPAATPQLPPGVARWDRKEFTVTAEPDADHLQISGPARPLKLDLVRAPHRKWAATFTPEGGAAIEVPLTPVPLFSAGLTGSRVELPGPGRLELRHEAPPRERRMVWLSLLAGVVTLAGLWFARPLQFAERLQSPAARRISRGLSAAIAALLILLALRRQERQLARTWEDESRFREDLAGAAAVTMRPDDLCDGTLGRDAKAGCSDAMYRPRVAALYREPYLYRCTWVTVPAKGTTTLRLRAPGSAEIRGYAQVQTPPEWSPSKRGELRLRVGKRPERRLGARVENFSETGDAAALTLINKRPTPEAVCVAAAAFGE